MSQTITKIVLGAGSGAQSFNLGNAEIAHVHFKMIGNTSCAFTQVRLHTIIFVRIAQDGTGGHVWTWPASMKWAGKSAPTLTTTANAVDIFQFHNKAGDYEEMSRALDVG